MDVAGFAGAGFGDELGNRGAIDDDGELSGSWMRGWRVEPTIS